MVKTTVYLDADVAIALRQLAQAEGRSQAELIREAVTRMTEAATSSRPKGIGQYRSGRSDVSARAEELLHQASREGKWR